MKYARFVDNVVVEIFVPQGGFSIEQCFHPDVVSQFVMVDNAVDIGYTKPVADVIANDAENI